jgi:hypothetical protein
MCLGTERAGLHGGGMSACSMRPTCMGRLAGPLNCLVVSTPVARGTSGWWWWWVGWVVTAGSLTLPAHAKPFAL